MMAAKYTGAERRAVLREPEYIRQKWLLGILVAILLTIIASWLSTRLSFEASISDRVANLEKANAMVIERLDANMKMLDRIYLTLERNAQIAQVERSRILKRN